MISCSVAGGEVGYRGAKKRLLQRLFLFPTGIYCRRESVQGTELFLDKNNFPRPISRGKGEGCNASVLASSYFALYTADGPANCPSVKIDWSRGPVLLFTHTRRGPGRPTPPILATIPPIPAFLRWSDIIQTDGRGGRGREKNAWNPSSIRPHIHTLPLSRLMMACLSSAREKGEGGAYQIVEKGGGGAEGRKELRPVSRGGDFFAPRNLWGNISLPSCLVMLHGWRPKWRAVVPERKKYSIVEGAVCFFVYMRSTFYSFLVVLKHTLWQRRMG